MFKHTSIAILALAAALTFGTAHAHDYQLASLKIGHPWARATVTPTGGAYLTIDNGGLVADRLVKVEGDVAQTIELHQHTMDGGVMKMRPVEGGIVLPPGRTALEPGNYHIMMIGLKEPLKEGTRFPLKLTFEKAGSIVVLVVVDKPGATVPAEEKHQH